MQTHFHQNVSRRKILTALLGGTAAAQVNPFGQAGIACSPFAPNGAQLCQTGIPTAEIETVHAPSVQEQSQWCWAACLEMIFRYYGMPISQRQIVYETFGALVNLPAQKDIILRNVNRPWVVGGRRFIVQSDFISVTPDVAAWDLMAKRPLIIGTMGHAMVLTALSYQRWMNGAGHPLEYTVRDPWPGQGRRPLRPDEQYGLIERNGGICLRVRVS